ncbi:MAG: hypothetical protein ABEH83_01120 [Halobacterium sp.]
MPSSGDDAASERAADSGATGSSPPEQDADAALASAIEAADGDPECALCSKPADYFLYEAGHVEKFVCWEHVSPHSAAVDGEDARPGRPLALSL